MEFAATLQFNDLNPNKDEALALAVTEIKNLPFPVIAVIPGAETGIHYRLFCIVMLFGGIIVFAHPLTCILHFSQEWSWLTC